jgi:hypothetical protein
MTAPAKPRWLDWLPLVGMVLTVAGLIWAASNIASRVDDNTRRIGVLEAADQKRTDTLSSIDARTARIEGRLEAMQGQKQ